MALWRHIRPCLPSPCTDGSRLAYGPPGRYGHVGENSYSRPSPCGTTAVSSHSSHTAIRCCRGQRCTCRQLPWHSFWLLSSSLSTGMKSYSQPCMAIASSLNTYASTFTCSVRACMQTPMHACISCIPCVLGYSRSNANQKICVKDCFHAVVLASTDLPFLYRHIIFASTSATASFVFLCFLSILGTWLKHAGPINVINHITYKQFCWQPSLAHEFPQSKVLLLLFCFTCFVVTCF